MDLIGIPFQLIVGPKGAKAGEVELKVRKGGERRNLPLDKAVAEVAALIKAARNPA
jgi:prolyl-tRNA synthetase